MELTQLRYFIEAAGTENISKAARNLNITQPSLSKSIARLEEELGVKLFYRYGKKILLSQNGSEFLEMILPAVETLQEAEDHFTQAKRHEKRLTVGIYGTSSILNPCLTAYLESDNHPSVKIITHIEKIIRLDIRDYDALLYSGEDQYFHKYKGTAIGTEKYLAAVKKGTIPETGGKTSLEKLAGLCLILSDKMTGAEHTLLTRCPSMQTILSVGDRDLQMQFVAAGTGICLIPESESSCFLAHPDIELIEPDCPGLERKMNICFKRKKLLNAQGREFRDFVYRYYHISDPSEDPSNSEPDRNVLDSTSSSP